jgi:MFS family permease
MSYGVLQDSYSTSSFLSGNTSLYGLVGTTLNGTLYMSLPIISTLLSHDSKYYRYRQHAAIAGVLLSSFSLILSGSATQIWQLIVLQGVLCGFGSALTYSPATLCLDSWFIRRKSYAYGVAFAAKNIVGTATPFLNPILVDSLGVRNTLRVWGCIVFATGIICVPFLKTRVEPASRESGRRRMGSWKFLTHPTFYIFHIANIVFSSGYGLPQTYLPSYAKQVLSLSSAEAALMLSLFNIPGIISCIYFGMLGDGLPIFGRYTLTPFTVTFLSAIPAAISVFLLWGVAHSGITGLALFSAVYGFFASAYSSTWGGALKEIQREAARNNEIVDTGVVYGLLNGGRGLGFVVGGLAGVELLKSGSVGDKVGGFGSEYGSVIVYTGVSAVVGGWSVLWSLRRLF